VSLKQDLEAVAAFLEAELEQRRESCDVETPGSYVNEAFSALQSLRRVQVRVDALVGHLRGAISLMPLGTKKRADWLTSAEKSLV